MFITSFGDLVVIRLGLVGTNLEVEKWQRVPFWLHFKVIFCIQLLES